MKKRYVLFIVLLSIAIILLLSGCGRKECKIDSDCQKAGFTSVCSDNTCIHTPIPGVCGNGIADNGETKCSCPQDLGPCIGAVAGSTLLQQTCVNDQCVADIPQDKVVPASSTRTISSQGMSFRVTAVYDQPFNAKKDTFDVKVSLDTLPSTASNVKIIGYELSAVDANRQTVLLSDTSASRPLLQQGSTADEQLILDFIGPVEGRFTNPKLVVDFEYTLTSASGSQQRTGQLTTTFTGITFVWVKPDVEYGCPESCDDGNPGTADSCGPETRFFCKHTPIAGACGNLVCDASENKCSCPGDCGECSGSAGQFMTLACEAQVCTSSVRPGLVAEPKSIFDDRNLNIFHLQNRFVFSNPTDVSREKLAAEFTLFNLREDVSNVRIDSVRLLDRSLELGFVNVNQPLNAVGQSITVAVPVTSVARPEATHTVSAVVSYSYDRQGQTLKGSFTKALEKITFITPGPV